MADRIVKVSLKGDVNDYTASLAKAATATRALGDSAEQNSRKIGAASDEAARRVAGIREQLVDLSRTKVNVATAVDTVAARTELERLRGELAAIDATDATAEARAETAAAEVQLRALQSTLNRIDGQTVTAHVRVDDAGTTAQMSGRISGLASAAAALSPAFGTIGATAAAGIGVIAPLAVSAGAGLGVLALGFTGVADTADLLEQRATATGASLETINQKLAGVNPATLQFATYLNDDLRPAFDEIQGRAAAGLLPGVQQALENVEPHLGSVGDFVGRLSSRMGELAVESSEALTSPVWMDFWAMIDENADPIVTDFVHTLLNMAGGFAGITTAFMPMARDVSTGIVEMSDDFRLWGSELAESEGFHTFEAYVRENWPKVQEIIGNLAETIGTLIEAGAPIGSAYLDAFVLLSEVLSALPVPVVQSLLTLFIAYRTLTGVSDIINGFATSFGAVSSAVNRITPGALSSVAGGMTTVGTAAGGATAPVGGFAGVMGKVSGIATAAGAIAGGMVVIGSAVSALGGAMAPELPRMEQYTSLLLGLRGGFDQINVAAAAVGTNTVTDISGFGDVLNRVVNPGAMDRLNDFGGSLFNVVTLGASDTEEGAATRRRSLEFIGGLDGSLAQMVNSGNAPLAAEQFAAIQTEAAKYGITTEQLLQLFPQYNDAVAGVANQQNVARDATAGANTQISAQTTAIQGMVEAAPGQYQLYNEALQGKIDKEAAALQATQGSTAGSTEAIQALVANTQLSLSEFAGVLDEDTAKKDAWREDVKRITERGGAEVGAAFMAMGIEAADLTDQMANATDEDFRNTADSMTRNTKAGGANSNYELSEAAKVIVATGKNLGFNTVESIAKELGIGTEKVRQIASDYNITLAEQLDPLMAAIGKEKPGSVARAASANVAKRRLDNADGSITDYYAQGGVRESHVAQIAPAGSWRVWAEPETGGEAYIPLSPAKRRRSLNIWQQTGMRLGVDPSVMQLAQGSIVDLGRLLQSKGARVGEHPMFGGVGRHGKSSLHYSGNAIDVNTRSGTSAAEQRELAPLAALARGRGFRTIFMTSGHYDHLHVDTGRGASMGSAGAPAIDVKKPPGTSPPFHAPISTAADAAMQYAYDEVSKWVAENTMSEPGGSGGGNVERWRGTALQALARVGQPASLVNTLLRRMNQESGGNPRAINLWDSNARKGIPSKGLLQTIDPTFQRYRDPALPNDVYHPLANIVASLRYTIAKYGSVAAGYNRKGGYDDGGIASGVGFMAKATIAPERVLSPRQTEAFEQMVSREFGATAFSGGGRAPININIDGATIAGRLEFDGDGIVRIVDGRIVEVLTAATDRAGYSG